jgi:hypothetical protein
MKVSLVGIASSAGWIVDPAQQGIRGSSVETARNIVLNPAVSAQG